VTTLAIFISVTVVSLISFAGAISLALSHKRLQSMLILLVAFAAGALLGDVFIHLLPESFATFPDTITAPLLILSGIILFFLLEKFVRWRHCHTVTSDDHPHPVATMNLIGDAVHNIIDGMLIAASYMISMPIGIATTVAVILHEIPTEIGDFGVLLHSGVSPKKALWFNFLSAALAILGAAITVALGQQVNNLASYLLPITAGAFLYIAASDLIPELHEENGTRASLYQTIALLLGMAVMTGLLFLE